MIQQGTPIDSLPSSPPAVFAMLLRHSFRRLTSNTADGEISLGIVSILAISSAPGAFFSIVLLNKYSTLLAWLQGNMKFNAYAICANDEYFFIVLSMCTAGMLTLLRWDTLLPSYQDFANLAPLPLKLSDVFIANLFALLSLMLLFTVDINAVSSLLFPLFVSLQVNTASAFVELAVAHALAVLGIGLFTFLSLLALQALMMSCLPDSVYRQCALFVRTTFIIFFALLLFSTMIAPMPVLHRLTASSDLSRFWPPLWFLSVFESHVVALHSKSLGAQPAAIALVTAGLLAIAGFALSYRRHFLLIAERREGPAHGRRPKKDRLLPTYRLSQFWVKNGVERACCEFIYTTLRRNESHLLLLSIWLGFGLLLTAHALQSFPNIRAQAWFTMPLQLSFFILIGQRQIFDLPAAIHANWVFRMNLNTGAQSINGLCRKMMLGSILVWLLPVYLPLVTMNLGWQGAVVCLLVDLPLILVAIKLLMRNYRYLPFTSTMHPSHNRAMISIIGGVGIVLVLIPMMSGLQAYALSRPAFLAVLAVASCAALAAVKLINAEQPAAMVEFEGPQEGHLAQLRLSGD